MSVLGKASHLLKQARILVSLAPESTSSIGRFENGREKK